MRSDTYEVSRKFNHRHIRLLDMRYDDGGPLKTKSMDFSVRIYNLGRLLNSRGEQTLRGQVVRAGTSIGANISESRRAESLADFIHKLSIAQKECEETRYWLELLSKIGLITEAEYQSIDTDAAEIDRILSASINTAKGRNKD